MANNKKHARSTAEDLKTEAADKVEEAKATATDVAESAVAAATLSASETLEKVSTKAEQVADTYSNGNERPLAGYVSAMTVFGALAGTALVIGRLAGKRLPEKVALGDFALMAVATHKLSRIIAKDAVTSPLRAPFTQYEEPAGAGELNESVQKTGWRHAVGELIECPFCLAVWIATAFTAGFTFTPRLTRWVAATFSAVGVSDALQFGYDALKKTDE